MKDIIALYERDDIHAFVGGLWRSEEFRESHRSLGYIHDQVERFAWLPRLFAHESNSRLERAHFSTWWNVIMIREDYDNPIIHDLYYLHELAHAASMPYLAGLGRAAFDEKMQRNELEASVLSEIAVYFEMPGLREASFSHPIYADRYLRNPMMRELWQANPAVAIETLRTMRRDIMTSKPYHEMDVAEKWIRRFSDQNAAYSVIWADRYREVEGQMALLQSAAVHNRREALDHFGEWIEEEAGRDQVDFIPFRSEAELFAPFYWDNKAKYAEAMKNR